MKRRNFLHASLGLTALWSVRRVHADAAVSPVPVPAKTLGGATISLSGADLRDFARSISGEVLLPDQPGYDTARRVWNAMFDKRPAVIARCASPLDVMLAVDFARAHQLLTAVRAGGHSMSGKSTCDGGIIIDLSLMQNARVDPHLRVARVDGGALLRHLDRETSVFGLSQRQAPCPTPVRRA